MGVITRLAKMLGYVPLAEYEWALRQRDAAKARAVRATHEATGWRVRHGVAETARLKRCDEIDQLKRALDNEITARTHTINPGGQRPAIVVTS